MGNPWTTTVSRLTFLWSSKSSLRENSCFTGLVLIVFSTKYMSPEKDVLCVLLLVKYDLKQRAIIIIIKWGGCLMNKKRFFVSAGLGYGVLTLLLVMMFTSGIALAAFPIAGVGGFVVAADTIAGEGFHLYPTIGETSEQTMYPMAVVDLDKATITNLNLCKKLTAMGYNVDVVIKATDDVIGNGLKLKVTGINAGIANFDGLDVNEHSGDYNNDGTVDALDKIDMKAPGLTLHNAQLNTHSLFANTITIPGMDLAINVSSS